MKKFNSASPSIKISGARKISRWRKRHNLPANAKSARRLSKKQIRDIKKACKDLRVSNNAIAKSFSVGRNSIDRYCPDRIEKRRKAGYGVSFFTEEADRFLINHYFDYPKERILKELSRSWSSIKDRVRVLKNKGLIDPTKRKIISAKAHAGRAISAKARYKPVIAEIKRLLKTKEQIDFAKLVKNIGVKGPTLRSHLSRYHPELLRAVVSHNKFLEEAKRQVLCVTCGKPVGESSAKGFCKPCYARYRTKLRKLLRGVKTKAYGHEYCQMDACRLMHPKVAVTSSHLRKHKKLGDLKIGTYKEYLQKYTDWPDIDWYLGDKKIAELFGISKAKAHRLRTLVGKKVKGVYLSQEALEGGLVYRLNSIEAKYDLFLHCAGIPHQHQVRIPGTGYSADFLIEFEGEDYVIEITSFLHRDKKGAVKPAVTHSKIVDSYFDRYKNKSRIYEELGLSYKWLFQDTVDEKYLYARSQCSNSELVISSHSRLSVILNLLRDNDKALTNIEILKALPFKVTKVTVDRDMKALVQQKKVNYVLGLGVSGQKQRYYQLPNFDLSNYDIKHLETKARDLCKIMPRAEVQKILNVSIRRLVEWCAGIVSPMSEGQKAQIRRLVAATAARKATKKPRKKILCPGINREPHRAFHLAKGLCGGCYQRQRVRLRTAGRK